MKIENISNGQLHKRYYYYYYYIPGVSAYRGW